MPSGCEMDRTPHWRQCIKIPVGDLFSVKRRNRELYLLQWICLSHASADPFVLALYLCCCFVFFSFDAADCIRTNSHPTLAEGKNKNVYLNNPKRNFSGRGGGGGGIVIHTRTIFCQNRFARSCVYIRKSFSLFVLLFFHLFVTSFFFFFLTDPIHAANSYRRQGGGGGGGM